MYPKKTTGGFSNTGAQPGIVNRITSGLGFKQPQSSAQKATATSNMTNNFGRPVSQGTNSGMLNSAPTPTPTPEPSFAQQNVGSTKVDISGNKTITPATKSNASVLAQQQALNKQGAGLVEDGIAGPKTSAAIAKYGTAGSTPTPETPTPTPTPTPETPKPTAPQASTNPLTNAQNLLETGQQTDLERERLATLDATQSGDAYNKIEERIAQNLEQQKQLDINQAEQSKNLQTSGVDLSLATGQEGVLNRLAAAKRGALSSEGAGLSSQLGAANTRQGLLQSGASTGLNAAQTQASRAQNTAGSVFSAGLLTPASLYTSPFSALQGFTEGNGSNSAIDRAVTAATAQIAGAFTADYATGKAKLATADGVQRQIEQTITQNPGINNTPISFLTDINKYISGQLGSAPQQLLAQQVKQYLDTLGLDPATVTEIASQQKGTLGELLESLRTTAVNQVESKNPQGLKPGGNTNPSGNINNSNSGNSTSGSSTGGSMWDW